MRFWGWIVLIYNAVTLRYYNPSADTVTHDENKDARMMQAAFNSSYNKIIILPELCKC